VSRQDRYSKMSWFFNKHAQYWPFSQISLGFLVYERRV
jgi:hypothetical protein